MDICYLTPEPPNEYILPVAVATTGNLNMPEQNNNLDVFHYFFSSLPLSQGVTVNGETPTCHPVSSQPGITIFAHRRYCNSSCSGSVQAGGLQFSGSSLLEVYVQSALFHLVRSCFCEHQWQTVPIRTGPSVFSFH